MEDRFGVMKHFIVTLVSMHAWRATNDKRQIRRSLITARDKKHIWLVETHGNQAL